MKKCPFCAEEIQDEAIFCRYCQHDLRAPVHEPPAPTGIPAPPSQTAIAPARRSLWGEALLMSAILYGISLIVLAVRVAPSVTSVDDLAPYAGFVIGGVIGGFLLHIPLYAAVLAIWRRARKTRDLPPRGCGTYAAVYVGGVVFEIALGLGLALVAGLIFSGLGPVSQLGPSDSHVTTPPPTQVVFPTYTPHPKEPIAPTRVPSPTTRPITLAQMEAALRDAGYSRGPFYDEEGGDAFAWTKDNAFEQVIEWPDGTIRLEIISAKSSATRSEHMERKLEILDSVFPPEFMAKLRQENETYNASATSSVSGKADKMYPPAPGDVWQTIWAQYNAKEVVIGSHDVIFALWFLQVTCPSQYSYCWFNNFPGQTFSGQGSFVFYTIWIDLGTSTGVGGSSG